MDEPLMVTGIDATGVAIGSKVMVPGRVIWMPTAMWILEQPRMERPPPPGRRIRVRHS